MFFCKFNDPLYLKFEKVKILTFLCNPKNFEMILNEIQEYIKDVEKEFVSEVLLSL